MYRDIFLLCWLAGWLLREEAKVDDYTVREGGPRHQFARIGVEQLIQQIANCVRFSFVISSGKGLSSTPWLRGAICTINRGLHSLWNAVHKNEPEECK